MEIILRRWIWLLDAVVIAIVAIVAADGTARFLSGLGTCRLPRSSAPCVRSEEHPPSTTIDAIVRRNIFRSDRDHPAPAIDSPLLAPLPLRLVAVMYAPRLADRRWSVAIIRDDGSRATLPFIAGARLRDATIDIIEATRVHLRRGDGQRLVLHLIAPPGSPATEPARAAPSFRDGIQQLGDRRYQVERRTLEAWLGNLRQLAKEVVVSPETRDGNPAGLRLDHIPPGGAFAAIGLRNGDVIRAVNGLDLDSPEHALDAYLKLRVASHISLAADRGGQRINLDYDIR